MIKIIYHPTEGSRAIPDEDDIPEGWFATPAAFGVITCPSLEQLAEMAAAKSEPEPAPADDRAGHCWPKPNSAALPSIDAGRRKTAGRSEWQRRQHLI